MKNNTAIKKFALLALILWIFYQITGFIVAYLPRSFTGILLIDGAIIFCLTTALPVWFIIRWKRTKEIVT